MRLMSFKRQRLLIYMLEHRFTSFKSQNIFDNQISFKRAIRVLKKKDLITFRLVQMNEWFLTRKGVKIARLLKEYAS